MPTTEQTGFSPFGTYPGVSRFEDFARLALPTLMDVGCSPQWSQYVEQRDTLGNVTQNSYDHVLYSRAEVLHRLADATGDPALRDYARAKTREYLAGLDERGTVAEVTADKSKATGKRTESPMYTDGTPLVRLWRETPDGPGRDLIRDRIVAGANLQFDQINGGAKTIPATYYNASGKQWTPRFCWAALTNSLAAWQVTGDALYARRIDGIVGNLVEMTAGFYGLRPTGLPWCTTSEFGEGQAGLLCCPPWMLSLLAGVLWDCHRARPDARIAPMVVTWADALAEPGVGLYRYGLKVGNAPIKDFTEPYYIASRNADWSLTDPKALNLHGSNGNEDYNHALDVAALFALAYHFGGGDAHKATALDLLATHLDFVVPYYTRPTSVSLGKPLFQIGPARKGNWWLRNSLGLGDWLYGPRYEAPAADAVTVSRAKLLAVRDAVDALVG